MILANGVDFVKIAATAGAACSLCFAESTGNRCVEVDCWDQAVQTCVCHWDGVVIESNHQSIIVFVIDHLLRFSLPPPSFSPSLWLFLFDAIRLITFVSVSCCMVGVWALCLCAAVQ